MSKKKLTADEKKTLLVKFFNDKKEFFSLKELEKVVPKEVGINEKQVKDILQQVLDDGLVDTEKIGTIVVYWSFPNKGKNEIKAKCQGMKRKLDEMEQKVGELQAKRSKISKQEDVQVLQTENDLLMTKVSILRQNLKEIEPISERRGTETPQDLEEKKKMIPVRIVKLLFSLTSH